VARPDRPISAYLDACCYIDWATGKDSGPIVESWLIAAQAGQVVLHASTLVLVEARGGSGTEPNPVAAAKLLTLLSEPYVRLTDVTRRIALMARELTADHPRLKGCDAVHMATAVFAQAGVLLTRNTRHFAAGTVVRGVWVDQPYEYGGPNIFSASEDDPWA
jgi:predicted nucleic acid-binding protein